MERHKNRKKLVNKLSLEERERLGREDKNMIQYFDIGFATLHRLDGYI